VPKWDVDKNIWNFNNSFFIVQQPLVRRLHHCRCFTITLRHTTLGRTPLDEWSARRRDLYLTTPSTHNRQTSMPYVGFEPAIPASVRTQTHAWDCAANGIGVSTSFTRENYKAWSSYICNVLHFPVSTLTEQSSTYKNELAAKTTDFPVDNFLACKKNLHESLNSLLLRTMAWDEF